MEDQLIDRVNRIRHALGLTRSEDVSSIRVERRVVENFNVVGVNFSGDRTKADLEIAAFTLIGEIASIKDHLKTWCHKTGRPFTGETLVNTCKSVGIVHDLWNKDKHAELNRPPRSGSVPKLAHLRQHMSMSTGAAPGSSVSISLGLATGKPKFQGSEGAKWVLVVDASIEDGNGNHLGQLQDICVKAISAWEAELAAAGVVLDPL